MDIIECPYCEVEIKASQIDAEDDEDFEDGGGLDDDEDDDL